MQRLSLPFLLSTFAVLCCPGLHADIAPAGRALAEGRVEDATSLLRPWIEQHPSDADAHLLLCRVLYAEEMIDSALSECEAAAGLAGHRSDIQLWLGRASGMKAGAANPIAAFPIARKVRDAFERSVRLDPFNIAAAGDLGEFYVAAPAIVGGGSGKARALAAKLEQLNQPAAEAESHRILGLLAEKEGDLAKAEAEFRRAAATDRPEAFIDLGAFYARQHQADQAAASVHSAIALDKTHGPPLVDAASVLVEAGREPDLARRLFQSYLDSPAKSDAAPAFKVHLRLGDLLARSGDRASAHREYAAAFRLAPNYAPARKAVTSEP